MAYRKQPDEMYCIRPLTGASAGWRVALVRRGEEYLRCFTVARYGSQDLALVAAKAWRDRIAQEARPLTKAEYSQVVRSNNSSGHPGVYLRRQRKRNAAGQEVEYLLWQAQTPEGVKPFRSKSFSVSRFGFDAAFELAVEARQEFVQALQGYYLHSVPLHLQPNP